MALYTELPVYRDTYQLILKVFELTRDFSREFKCTLGQDMRRDAVQLLRGIFRANKATDKKAHLECFLDEFELLKLEVRLCVEMSLDVDGFTNEVNGSEVIIKIDSNHRLLKLARNLPWDVMLDAILPDLQRTDKNTGGWVGHCEFASTLAPTFYSRCLI